MNVYVELATMVMVYSVNHMSRQCAPLSIRLVSVSEFLIFAELPLMNPFE
ncbi:unnamed protein product [Toxocara canis]|uniref:Uncharacterized protein n=1 Tax=Toxocara canis TaxID=6265 RepID=A0A183U8W6_TOXCA|nr:unnamed protein product [Toxocara canis]